MIVDSARIAGQIEGLRQAFGREIRHVHVTASRETCAERYEERRSRAEVQEADSYEAVIADPTEAQVDKLAAMADIAIDTDRDGRTMSLYVWPHNSVCSTASMPRAWT